MRYKDWCRKKRLEKKKFKLDQKYIHVKKNNILRIFRGDGESEFTRLRAQ